MSELSTAAIKAAAAEMQDRISGRQADLVELRAALERDQRELGLMLEILKLRSRDNLAAPDATGESATPGQPASNGEHPVVAAATEILKDADRPLHIQELTSAIRSRGVPIPGKGEIANVIALIRNRPEISRPQRGLYALSEWGAGAALSEAKSPSTTSRRRPMRRRRSTAARARRK